MSSFWWQDLGLDFLAQADVWSAGIQEWRLKVKIPLVASPESPDSVLWAVCCRSEGRGHSIPSAMRAAPGMYHGTVGFSFTSWPSAAWVYPCLCQVSTFLCPMPLFDHLKSWEDRVFICTGLIRAQSLAHVATSHFARHMAMMLIDTMSWNQDPPFWSKISEEAKAGRNIVRVLYSETRHSWRTSFRDASVECPASV